MNYIKESIDKAAKKGEVSEKEYRKSRRIIFNKIGEVLYPDSKTKISRANLVSKFYYGNRAGIPVDHLKELCNILGMSPSDVLQWQSDEKTKVVNSIMSEVKKSLEKNLQ